MPPKLCAKCNKTVYPTEELKCLDKVWHKFCFKCQVCGMTLNMKNYKGYDKLPYCNAHYPTTKHTVVADTPENRRITANTKIQSNIKYHADFEAAKGTKISVADDPETERIKKNMATISNISYHGEIEKKMAQETHRPSHAVEDVQSGPHAYSYDQQQHGAITINQPYRRQPGSIQDYEPMSKEAVHMASPYSNQRVGHQVYSSQAAEPQPRTRRVGSIVDYDPVNEQYGSVAGQYVEPTPEPTPEPQQYRQPSPPPAEPQYRQPSPPPTEVYRQASPPPVEVEYRPPSPPAAAVEYREPSPPPAEAIFRQPSPPPTDVDAGQPRGYGSGGRQSKGMVCRAMYDYTAADTDEVSFNEGDVVTNCMTIDEGWMTGRIERTGQHGMLPANYVERV